MCPVIEAPVQFFMIVYSNLPSQFYGWIFHAAIDNVGFILYSILFLQLMQTVCT
jgi:hypothetical protein